MKVGDKFSSFEELSRGIKLYEGKVHSNYWIKDSKTLTSQIKSFPTGRCSKANPDLKYYFIRYHCIKGGRKFVPKNKERKTLTFKQGCQSSVNIVLSSCGKYLVVKDIEETHNHEHTEQQFKTLPNQRLNFDKKSQIGNLLASKANKKIIQESILKNTGCLVTLKDLTNLNRKPTCQVEFSKCLKILRETYNCFVDVLSDGEGNYK